MHASPTLMDLQAYLIQLHEILSQREEAVARRQRATQDRERAHALDLARIQAATEHTTQEAVAQAARINAEAAKAARLDSLRQDSLRNAERERTYASEQLLSSRQSLESIMHSEARYLRRFPVLVAAIHAALANTASAETLLATAKMVERSSGVVRKFSELVDVALSLGLPGNEALAHLQPSGFERLTHEFEQLRQRLEHAPAAGLATWQPVDLAGVVLAPWDCKMAAVWRHRGSGSTYFSLTASLPFENADGRRSAETVLKDCTAASMAGRTNWRLPTRSEARVLTRLMHRELPGFDKLKRIWIAHSTAPGRASAFHLGREAREVTGINDNCQVLLVSH